MCETFPQVQPIHPEVNDVSKPDAGLYLFCSGKNLMSHSKIKIFIKALVNAIVLHRQCILLQIDEVVSYDRRNVGPRDDGTPCFSESKGLPRIFVSLLKVQVMISIPGSGGFVFSYG